VILAGAVGALVAFILLRSPASPPQSVPVNVPAPSQAAAPQPANAAAPAPAQPQWTKLATYGSWEVRCQTPNANAKVCAAWLELINQQKQVIMAWIVGPDNRGALQTIFQTPTGVRVAAGVDVKLGNAAARHINYINCLSTQCTAGGAMDDAFVKDTIAAQKAEVTLYAPDGKGINFGIPVTGFDKAVAAVKTGAPAK